MDARFENEIVDQYFTFLKNMIFHIKMVKVLQFSKRKILFIIKEI